MWKRNGITYYPLAVYTICRAEIQFYHLKTRPLFQDQVTRTDLLEKLKKIVGTDIRPDKSSFPLSSLSTQGKMTEFLHFLEEIIAML